MTNEFSREERYMVFKVSDVAEHLTTIELIHLERLYEIQRVGRKEAGKKPLECVVVEQDWPEYEPTWKAIEARVSCAQAQNAPSVPDGWKEAAIAWEVCASIHREYGKGKDPFFNTRQGDFVKHANDARAMLAAAPETKP